MWCLLPGEFGDVEYRSLRADTHVALGGFFHAAQAGADAASHHVFERNAAGIPLLSRQCGDRFHHRYRSAGGHQVELLRVPHRVLSDETLFAGAAIFGGAAELANFRETLALQKVAFRSSTEEKHGGVSRCAEGAAIVEHGGSAYTATDEQHPACALFDGWDGKTVSQRVEAIELIACLQMGQSACAVADQVDEQIKSSVGDICVVDRNGTAQERCRRTFDGHLHELSGKDGRHFVVPIAEVQQQIVVTEHFRAFDEEVFGKFLHDEGLSMMSTLQKYEKAPSHCHSLFAFRYLCRHKDSILLQILL